MAAMLCVVALHHVVLTSLRDGSSPGHDLLEDLSSSHRFLVSPDVILTKNDRQWLNQYLKQVSTIFVKKFFVSFFIKVALLNKFVSSD